MSSWSLYILKFSISLSLIWIFYQVFLRRLTFYNWNRFYLLLYTLLCFFIPLINIQPVLDRKEMGHSVVVNYVPVVDRLIQIPAHPSATIANSPAFSASMLLWIVLLAGSCFFLLRLCIRFISLQRLTRQAVKITDGFPVIYQVNGQDGPFSFGNKIYLNRERYAQHELEEIILHEFIHVKQKHSLDIILAELICVLNWYNPFSWLLRRSIRQNLEFIADEKVLQSGLDRRSYQWLLLKVSGSAPYPFANSFSFSSLKKRIVMMNSMKTAKRHLLRFLFLLPVLSVLMLAFRSAHSTGDEADAIFLGIVMDAYSHQQITGAQVTDKISGKILLTDKNGFFKFNIAKDRWSGSSFDVERDGYEKQLIRFAQQPGGPGRGEIYIVGLLRDEKNLDKIPAAKEKAGKPKVFLSGWSKGIDASKTAPGYEEALIAFEEFLKMDSDMNGMIGFNEKHPEISLFYSCEDGKGLIVFFRDGKFEKYQYPGAPGMEALEKKYGPVPDFYKSMRHPAGSTYVEKWKRISEAAEKVFRTDNPNVIAIVFPGDSRVIAVPKNGKPRIYDMDNEAPEERPAFENEYGKLPPVVPPASQKLNKDFPPRMNGKDTVPAIDASLNGPSNQYRLKKTPGPGPLFFIDGKEVSIGNNESIDKLIDPDQIESVEVLKDSNAIRRYGIRASGGVVLIRSKNDGDDKVLSADTKLPLQPPYIDEVSVEAGVMVWKIKKNIVTHPVFLLDGKIIGRDEKKLSLKPGTHYLMEMMKPNPDIEKKYGIKKDEYLVNYVSPENRINPSARLFPPTENPNPLAIQYTVAEANVLNTLVRGIETPLRISVEGLGPDDMIVHVRDDMGSIRFDNGIYYVKPSAEGNMEISIFKKDVHPQLLNSRFFRVKASQ